MGIEHGPSVTSRFLAKKHDHGFLRKMNTTDGYRNPRVRCSQRAPGCIGIQRYGLRVAGEIARDEDRGPFDNKPARRLIKSRPHAIQPPVEQSRGVASKPYERPVPIQ